jgi:hypothetical protein
MSAERLIRRKSRKADSSQLTADSKRRASAASISTSEKLRVVVWSAEGRNELRPYKVKANLAFACAALVLHAR